MSRQEQEYIFIETALRFEDSIKAFGHHEYKDLRGLMTAVPNVRIREGFVLDGYYSGDRRNAVMKLYATGLDSVDRYLPAPEEYLDQLLRRRLRFVWKRPQCHLYESGIEAMFDEMPDYKAEPKIPEISPFREGQYIEGTIPPSAAETVPDLEKYLELDFTPEAVWEAVLLLRASRLYLPHRWHGCYDNGLLVVDNTSLRMACDSVNDVGGSAKGCYNPWADFSEVSKLFESMFDDPVLTPEVDLASDGMAVVRYCYWNDWSGLIQVTVEVLRTGNGIHLMKPVKKVLIEYHSRMRYCPPPPPSCASGHYHAAFTHDYTSGTDGGIAIRRPVLTGWLGSSQEVVLTLFSAKEFIFSQLMKSLQGLQEFEFLGTDKLFRIVIE